MAIQKKVNGTWQPINPKQLKGIPYSGTLPAVLAGTKAGYLHKYKIYGNLTQNGTPTPENPIVPSECGERTGNLFNKSATYTAGAYTNLYTISGLDTSLSYTCSTSLARISGASTASIYLSQTTSASAATNGVWAGEEKTFTPNENGELYVLVRNTAAGGAPAVSDDVIAGNITIMLTEGSTAPTSYIPYGYKLPLLSGSTPVDIYLGESQTTRRIKKLVLTGEENWSLYGNFAKTFKFTIPISVMGISSHYSGINVADFDIKSGVYLRSSAYCIICDVNCQDLTAFKQFLTGQYTNGTPVTIWYVLATEETATANEPLRKIGDYADTLDSTQTTAQIPTSAGSTTISWAGQGLAPSEFDSIQEWVDTPTYKRVNGEWVADN